MIAISFQSCRTCGNSNNNSRNNWNKEVIPFYQSKPMYMNQRNTPNKTVRFEINVKFSSNNISPAMTCNYSNDIISDVFYLP